MKYTACFTGHRPQNLICGFNEYHPASIKIKYQLERMIKGLINKKNVVHFITGMALGVDMWAAEIILELKTIYPYISLDAALPCKSQSYYWSKLSKERYKKLLQLCDTVTIIQEHYTADCMMKRNMYMVDNSSYVIAVWNGKASGTAKTIYYAKKMKKNVYCIDSETFKMRAI